MNFQKETKGTGMHPTNPGKDNTTKFDFHSVLYMRGEDVYSEEYGKGKVKFVQPGKKGDIVRVGFTNISGASEEQRYYYDELCEKNGVYYIKNEQIVKACVLSTDDVQWLIKNKTDVNAKDKNGLTALCLLSRRAKPGEKDVLKKAKLLIEAGADVNFRDHNDDGLLESVISPRYVTVLLKAGIIIDSKYAAKLIRKWKAEIEHLNMQTKKKCNKENVTRIEQSIIDLNKQIEMIEARSVRI